MKKFLLRLLLGGEELAERMIALVELRAKAVQRHATNKQLVADLADGQEALQNLKSAYHVHREALESAYKLELN